VATQKPKVVYLDPMYCNRRMRRLSKEMQFLQTLLGEDLPESQSELLTLALKVASDRVVVSALCELHHRSVRLPTTTYREGRPAMICVMSSYFEIFYVENGKW
jgi:hypothetical protein